MSAIEKPGPTGSADWVGFVPTGAAADAAAIDSVAAFDETSTIAGFGFEAAGKGFSGVGPSRTTVGAGPPAAGNGFSAVGRGDAVRGVGFTVDDATVAGRGGVATVVGGVAGVRGWA